MNRHTLYRAALAAFVAIFATGCASSPGRHASAGNSCVQASHSSGAACATVQVRAAD